MIDLFLRSVFGIAATLLAYIFSLAVHRRWRWVHPLLLTCALLIGLLLLLPQLFRTISLTTFLDQYAIGGKVITFFLKPATVALAVPLYKHRLALRRHAVAIAVSLLTGGLTGILSAGAMAVLFHGTHEIVSSVLSKSVTTPIAVEITRALGGKPEITAALTVCSGLLGAVVGVPLLRALGMNKPSAVGLAIGTSSHGIGTSSLLRSAELPATYSALALALNGIFTAALLTPLAPVIQKLF